MSSLKNLLIGSAIFGIGMYSLMKNKKRPIVMSSYSSSKPTTIIMGTANNEDVFASYVTNIKDDGINSNVVIKRKTPKIDYSLITNHYSKTQQFNSELEAKTEDTSFGLTGSHSNNSYSAEATVKQDVKTGWLSKLVKNIGLFGEYDKSKKESAGIEVNTFNNTYRFGVKNIFNFFFKKQPLTFNAYRVA